MPAAGPAFVTPHALRQFRARIANLPDHHALAAILHGLANPSNIRQTTNGVSIRVRVRKPYPFRAIVRGPDAPGRLPVVVTILRSGS